MIYNLPQNIIFFSFLRVIHKFAFLMCARNIMVETFQGRPSPLLSSFLTVVNTFSPLFQEKYFFSFVIPPFHLCAVIALVINGLRVVELWVEYGWNYVKFHPYSIHDSTLPNLLILKHITYMGWKGGITFRHFIFL